VGFDFKTKQVCFSKPLYPSNEEQDMKTILAFFNFSTSGCNISLIILRA